MTQAVLTLNAGSSSLKVALYPIGGDSPLALGQADRIGPEGTLRLMRAGGAALPVDRRPDSHAAALDGVIAGFRGAFPDLELRAVGHRVVHGGPDNAQPVIVTPQMLAELARFELERYAP